MQPSDETTTGGGLIGWFVRNPVAANLLMVVLLIGGILFAGNLQTQVFPTIQPGIVTVTVPYPGATPAEVEEGVTRRVEEAVLGIDGVKRVSSTASENIGTVTIELADFADEQIVKDDVQTAVESLADFPPENAERETIRAPNPTGGVVTLVVVGRSEEHTSELQSPCNLVCRLLLEKKKKKQHKKHITNRWTSMHTNRIY